jgi:hypothetical protein
MRRPVAQAPSAIDQAAVEAPAAPAEPPAPAATETPRYTPSGLPLRSRQASLAKSLRTNPAPTVDEPGKAGPSRTPEEIRKLMTSYQSGTKRARSVADQGTDPGAPTGAPPPDPTAAAPSPESTNGTGPTTPGPQS